VYSDKNNSTISSLHNELQVLMTKHERLCPMETLTVALNVQSLILKWADIFTHDNSSFRRFRVEVVMCKRYQRHLPELTLGSFNLAW
jgi:hypothetical protein